MSRLKTALKTIVPTMAFALLAGWSVYRGSPQGLLRGLGTDPCPDVSHSFSAVYIAILGVAAGVAIAVAAAVLIASRLRLFGSAESSLRGLVMTCVWVAAGLAVAMLFKFPVEWAFPLQPGINCAKLAGAVLD